MNKNLKSPTIVEENFSVHDLLSAWENKEHERSDIQPAHSLNSMISRTENAINEVEATISNAEVKLGEAMDHAERVLNQSRQHISSDSTTEVCATEDENASLSDCGIISDATISEEIHENIGETAEQREFGSDETVGSLHGQTATTTTSYCTAMSELDSENRETDSSGTKVPSDYELQEPMKVKMPDESDLAQQILLSAASLRMSESDEKLHFKNSGAASQRTGLSSRSSLTDAQFIEQQTRTSFRALFGEPIPAGENRSFGDFPEDQTPQETKPKIVFKEMDISQMTSTDANAQNAIASGTYGSSDMLGASSVFSDDVFNSRQDAPLSAPDQSMTVFNFPSTTSHPNQMLHPGLGIQQNASKAQPLSQIEIDSLIEDKAYQFSLKIIQDCIEELQQEVKYISDIEEQAQVLLQSTLVASLADNVERFRPAISTQNTVGTNFISSFDRNSPDASKRDYVTQWLSQDADNGSCTLCYNDFEPPVEYPTETPAKQLSDTTYESSEDEDAIVEVLPLNKRTYGSFDHTAIRDAKESNLSEVFDVDCEINELIKSVVSAAVTELQAECRFESELSRTTAELVLEILASAIQVGRDSKDVRVTMSRSETEESTEARYIMPAVRDSQSSSDQSFEPTVGVEAEIKAEQKRKLAAEMVMKEAISQSGQERRDTESHSPEPTRPRAPSIAKVAECDRHLTSSIDIYREMKKRTYSTSSSCGTVTEEEDHLRKVRFGSCKIHPYEPNDPCDESFSLDAEDETEDLIESEAIALTEDAIFLAKRELYKEMTRANDEQIRVIAESIVSATIDAVINDIKRQEMEEELQALEEDAHFRYNNNNNNTCNIILISSRRENG